MKRTSWPSALLGLSVASSLALAVACATTGGSANGPGPETFTAQVALGQATYGQHCADCHGAAGQGGAKAPRLVGLKDGALPLEPPADRKHRKTRFVTVMDVADFAVHNMPADKPGSLTPEAYWSVLAFDLHANGIDLDKKLTPEVAAALAIPR